jgi:hypothetical protein
MEVFAFAIFVIDLSNKTTKHNGKYVLNMQMPTFDNNLANLDPILRLLNLQLQRQRCSRLERFYVENFYSKNALCY